jgi:iron complex transport system substrate-binding protein
MGADSNLKRRKIMVTVALLAAITLAWPGDASARTVIDSRGRSVELPEKVTKVAPLIPAFAQMTEMLTKGGGKISAYPTSVISGYFKKVFPDIVASNPKGYDSMSIEDIIASGAQVAFGPDLRLSEEQRSQLERAGVAVVAVNDIESVEAICRSFLLIGDILGPEERARAEEFIAYYKGNEAKAKALGAMVPETQRLKVLALYGQRGVMTTVNSRDIAHEHITAAGGINVAADYLPESRGMALMIDPEQVLGWAPDIILASTLETRQEILSNPALAEVPAVKSGRVLVCPQGIFLWSVRSGEGALMALWLGVQMYSVQFKSVDVKEMVRDFFKDFYDYELPEDELEAILSGRTRDLR